MRFDVIINMISVTISIMSRRMGKATICIGEKRDTNSTIPLLLKSEISSFLPSPVTVQAGLCGLCRTWSEPKLFFFFFFFFFFHAQAHLRTPSELLANS